ncbi:MAG: transglycosylase SLT domain-containing protein [Chromatiales bacterium]|nr:transglycosylase SLT domain-containing protein [Chromatiales bacterium]
MQAPPTSPQAHRRARLGAWVLGIAASVAVAAGLPGVEHEKWSDEFDPHFRKYSKRYFGPHFDWHWFKAQGIVESRLNPKAKSPAGAVGIMQVLPSTFEEIAKVNPSFVLIDEPEWNIAAGIYYDRTMYRKWPTPRPSEDRLFLAFASYNAGYGRVLRALKSAGADTAPWSKIRPMLPSETRAYLDRISTVMGTEADRPPPARGIEAILKRRS